MQSRPGHGAGRIDPVALFRELEAHKTDAPALAEPVDRAIARFIDFAIATGLFVLVFFGLFALIAEPATAAPRTGPGSNPNRDESRLSGLAGAAAAAIYLPGTELWGGRTVGKRVMQLSVVSGGSFARPSFGRRLVRVLGWALPLSLALAWWSWTLLTFTGLVALAAVALALCIPATMLFDPDKRGIHDRLAGTRVVVERR